MHCNSGQVSLEFLLVFSVFVSALLVIVSAIGFAYEQIAFAVDASNARSFGIALSAEIQKISIFSDGSSSSVTATPISKWRISAESGELAVVVEGKNNSKKFSFSVPGYLLFSYDAEKKTVFGVRKENNVVLVENSE